MANQAFQSTVEEYDIIGKQGKLSQIRGGRRQFWDKQHMMMVCEVSASSTDWGNWDAGVLSIVLESWRNVNNLCHPEYLAGMCEGF